MAKAPKTKAQFVDRMLMADFSGDIRDLFPNREVKITRLSANVLDIYDINNQRHFNLVIRRPRSEEQINAAQAKREAKAAGKSMPRKRAGKPAADKGAQH